MAGSVMDTANPGGIFDVWKLERPSELRHHKIKPPRKGSMAMASEKQRQQERAVDRKLKRPATSKVPKDGDRRHRGADLARLEQERKEAARHWNLDVGWTDAPE